MRCPQCSAEAAKVGAFWICPTHGQLPEPKLFVPLRIFLSYGHDSNEELVLQIYDDLKKRGHDVWFDKSEIKFGDDWRHSITDGILKSNRVLSFLSKHSTRDPGVCRDEIAIAIGVKGGTIQTILVESEQEVQPPVNIGHIQWLDMHDWKERRAAGEVAWKQWYQAKLAEILPVVESEESRRFAGEIETLNGHLKPIKSEARICHLLNKGFYGRQWLFEAVEKWRQDTKLDSRLFWIMGAPGVGKSAFAAQLTHTRGDTVIAAQFCEWDKPDHRNAQRVVRSLAFQLATRLPDYRKLLLTLPEIAELDRKDAAELFDYLLANPLRSVINGDRERYLIVIDALDEAGEAGRNPLVEMLARNAQRLPDWLGLVVTSRPEFDVKTPLQALNPFPLDTKSESNRGDIRDYLRRELASRLQNRPDADHLVEQILEKSEGVFLYVESFCEDIRHGYLSLDHPEEFPQGLGGKFFKDFQRYFPDLEKFRKDVRPALRAILAACEPLPLEILQRLFNWQDEELLDFTRPLASLFPVGTEDAHEVIKPYHKSVADWLADEAKAGPFFVSVLEGHRMLAEFGWQEYERGVQGMSRYFCVHLPFHLELFHDKWLGLMEVLENAEFLLTKLNLAGGDAVVDDFYRAYIAVAARPEPDLRCRLTEGLLRFVLSRQRCSDAALNIRLLQPRLKYRENKTFYREVLRLGRCRPVLEEHLQNTDEVLKADTTFALFTAALDRREGRLSEAKGILEELLRNSRPTEKSNLDHGQTSQIQYELAYITFLSGDYSRSVSLFDESAESAKKAGDQVCEWISRCVQHRVEFLVDSSKSEAFLEVLKRAKPHFAERRSDPVARANAERWLENLSAHFFEIAFVRHDIKTATQHLGELESHGSYFGGRAILPYRARLAMLLEDWENAVAAFKEYLRDKPSLFGLKEEGLAQDYLDYGISLSKLSRTSEACEVWQRGLDLPDHLGNKLWKNRIAESLKSTTNLSTRPA